MAIFKTIARRPRKDGFWQVYIRVTVERKVGYLKTDKMVTGGQVTKTGEVTDPYVLEYCAQRIIEYNNRLNRHDTSRWSLQQVLEFLRTEDSDLCFSDYARGFVDRMFEEGKEKTSRNYLMALQHLERFCGTNKVMFSDLTSSVVARWLETMRNTQSAKEKYPTYIRTMFYGAMREYNDYDTGVIRIKTNPWVKVRIPKHERPEKRAISPEQCREFFSAPLPPSKYRMPTSEYGRDVAMMVLCLAGMNVIDLYNLKKENYRDGRICYHRIKTRIKREDSAYFEIRVEPIIMPLLEKYRAADDDPYLLMFHSMLPFYDSFLSNVNMGIQRLCECMGIKERLYSTYTFRHTWGTVAQNDCGATIADVAFAMNHSQGFVTTRGYLKIDFSPAWELNKRVIDFIFFSNESSKQGLSRGVYEPIGIQFRIAPKYMVCGRAYFRGQVLAEVQDTGFSGIEDVIAHLVPMLPDTIPDGCAVQFRIRNVDTEKEVVYERTKGKGF